MNPVRHNHGKSVSSHKYYILILLFISGFVLFYRLGTLPLIDRDETRYAMMAKGMLERHNWVIPYLNNEPHPDKPPMFIWLVAISFKVFGINEFSARLIPTLLALGTILTVYFLGSLFWNPRTGFLAGIILSTSIGFFGAARFVITDMTLTFFSTLAITLILAGLHYRKPWFYFLSYLSFSCAMLTKGPVGIVLPALILFIYLWKTKQIPRLKEMYLGWGILIILVISLPWYFLVNTRLPGYLYFFFIRENVLRFLTREHQRAGPLYYYIPVAILGLFPWIWFLPASLRASGKEILDSGFRRNDTKRWISWWNDPPRFFCLVWFAVGFILFSLSGSKLPTYLLPYIAPAALLIAFYWDKAFSENQSLKWLTSLSCILCILGLLLIFYGYQIPIEKFRQPLRDGLGWPMWTEAGLLILMGIASWIFMKMKRLPWTFGAIAFCNIILIFHLALFDEGPKFAESHSTRAICHKLNILLQKDDTVVVYHPNRWSVSFYLKSSYPVEYIDTLEEIAVVLNQPGKTYVILEKVDDLEKLQPQVSQHLYLLAKEGSQSLVSN